MLKHSTLFLGTFYLKFSNLLFYKIFIISMWIFALNVQKPVRFKVHQRFLATYKLSDRIFQVMSVKRFLWALSFSLFQSPSFLQLWAKLVQARMNPRTHQPIFHSNYPSWRVSSFAPGKFCRPWDFFQGYVGFEVGYLLPCSFVGYREQ